MRWLTVLLAMLLLLGANPGLLHLVAPPDHHDCTAAEAPDNSCPEDEKGCAGEVHTCMCHAWPAFLPAAQTPEPDATFTVGIIQPVEGRALVPEDHRLRVERPPRTS